MLSTEKQSELSIWGESIGGSAGPHPYHSAGIRIDSRTDWMHEVWIKPLQGPEVSYHIPRPDVPLRAGQDVELLTLKQPNRPIENPVLLLNRSADRSLWLLSPRVLVYAFGECSTNTGLTFLLDATLALVIA